MAYEQRDMTGTLFQEREKRNERSPEARWEPRKDGWTQDGGEFCYPDYWAELPRGPQT